MSEQSGFYDVVDQPWPSDPTAKGTEAGDVHAKLTAIERYSAAEFQDSQGHVVHRYYFPSTDEYFFNLGITSNISGQNFSTWMHNK